MKFDTEVTLRIINTLQSPNRLQRITHFLYSKALFALPESLRIQIFKGDQKYCPVCQNHLSSFLILHRPYHLWCPICRSLQRHRLVWLFFQQETDLFDGQLKRMLHIAPEPAFVARLSRQVGLDYLSADLNDPQAMVKMDISDIQYPSDSFDVIYCSHVLEHVPDDRAAIRELRRVLRPDGWAVILVPITSEHTIEENEPQSPSQRERLFGQHDHVRSYGNDFADRVEQLGFVVTPFSASDIVTMDRIDEFGISTDDIIYYCKKV